MSECTGVCRRRYQASIQAKQNPYRTNLRLLRFIFSLYNRVSVLVRVKLRAQEYGAKMTGLGRRQRVFSKL